MSSFAENDDEKFDEVFMQIAGQIGSVQGLLDKFFGFMHRKTDFYVEYDPKIGSEAKMGFPIGVPEKMVLNSFKKHKMKDYKVEMEGITAPRSTAQSSSSAAAATPKSEGKSEVKEASPSVAAVSSSVKSMDPNAKQIPIGNGGVAENYYWTQTLTEVTIYVDADSTSRGRDIECIINPKTLKLSVLGGVLIEGEFEEAVRVDESMWTLNIGGKGMLMIILYY